jgi:protease IV
VTGDTPPSPTPPSPTPPPPQSSQSRPLGPPAYPAPVAAPPRRGLSYGAFLGRALTVAVLAPLSFLVVPLVAILVIASLVAAVAGSVGTIETDQRGLGETTSVGGDRGASSWVLVVPVEGPILADAGGAGFFGGFLAGGREIRQTLEDAADDDRVAAVVLVLNTPGGSPVGSEEIATGVEAVKAAGKPVVAHVTEISASGGMWAMAPADEIIANPSSLVGSVGVIFGPLRAYDGVVALDGGIFGGGVETTGGIEEFYITAGTSKDLGNPYRKLTDDERRSLQETVDVLYDRFVDHVAANRPVTADELRNGVGALIFDASRAVELGLVDRVGDEQTAWAAAAAAAGLDRYDVREPAVVGGFLGALFGARFAPERPAADLSGLCGPSPRAFLYHGDLGSFCAAAALRN